MSRTVFLALAGFAIVSAGPAFAEANKTEATPAAIAAPATSTPATSVTATPAAAAAPAASPASSSPATPESAPITTGANPDDTKPAGAAAPPAAPAKPAPPPEPTLKASIDLGSQTMTVSENGSVRYSWKISSGTSDHPTPRGTFRPQWTAKMWYSRKYDNAPMPNAVFIHGGVAIHATPHVSALGRPASHGCIRLAPTNAKTFYSLVYKHGLKSVRVSVYGTPKWGSPAIASRKRDRNYVSRNSPTYRTTSAYGYGYEDYYAKPRYRKPPKTFYSNNGQRYYRSGNGSRVVYYRPRRTYQTGFGYDW